jgi:hypothetical protein
VYVKLKAIVSKIHVTPTHVDLKPSVKMTLEMLCALVPLEKLEILSLDALIPLVVILMLVDLTLNAWKAMVENLNVYVYLDSNPVSFLVKVAR